MALVALGAIALLGGSGGGPVSSPATAPATASAEVVTTAPTAEPSPEPTGVPTVPPETPPAQTAPPTAAPTVPAGTSVAIAVVGSEASSSVNAKSGPGKAHDGSPATTWLEGAGDVEGQSIEIRIPPTAVTRLSFSAGVQASDAAYKGNPRPHNITITFDDSQPIPVALTDYFGQQTVDIPTELGIASAQLIRITIIDTYPATKTSFKGSPTTTAGFSEIRVFGIAVGQ